MKVSNLLAAVLLIGAAPTYAANARCDQCDPRGFENVAKGLGVGDHVIFSLSQGLANGYSVEAETLDRRGGSIRQVFAYPRPLTIEESLQFDALKMLHRDTGGSLKYEVTVPIRNIPIEPGLDFRFMSIHEFARRPGDWHRISQGVVQWAQTPVALGQIGQWWQIAGSMVGVAGTEIEVTVVFDDGGKITLKMDYGTKTMAEQVGPMRDSDNNVVPVSGTNPSDVAGFFAFSSSINQSRMNEHLSALGWAMRFPSPTAQCPFIGRIIYECGWTGGDLRTVACQRLTRC